MIVRYNTEFFGSEEIIAKKNQDGTYSVTLKTAVKEEGADRELDIVIEIPRSRVSIEVLASNDSDGTMYKVTQVDRLVPEPELPEHTPSPADWRMLGYDLYEPSRLYKEETE